jgi:putative membrane-bound dehydrogenase-like protein
MRVTPTLCRVVVCLVFFAVHASMAAVEPNPQSSPLLNPSEALQRMTLPPGFKAELLVAEPDLVQPIAFCWDERGRIWVVEGNTYPERAGKPPVPRPDEDPSLDQLTDEESASLFGGSDRILIFSDENGDGVYETRKVFLEKLNLVSGIEVGYGGVYVGAAPYFLHIPLNADGDKPAGPPRVLADGFGWQDTHETLNSFIWGPDGWLYGCHGVFTHSSVRVCTGPAGTRQRTPMNCAYWRWHPVREEFELFAQGTSNPWGLDYNAEGQFFAEACVIPHFWHVIQGAYYLRQSNPLGHFNPYVYKNIETIADHAHFVGKTHGTPHEVSSDSGGGHAHCGLCIYQSDHFPAEFKGRPLFGNIHGKRINQENLVPEGSGYRAAHLPDFFKSNDQNFTAVTIKTAPDGGLVVSDWYDRQKCHTRQPEIWDRSNGRLYRISYDGWKPWKYDASLWEPARTLELQLQENGWLDRMARRRIGEYSRAHAVEAGVLESATSLLKSGALASHLRLKVMWWLHAANPGGTQKLWNELMSDSDSNVRRWAVQLRMETRSVDTALLGTLKKLAADPEPVVRLAVASSLQRLKHEDRWDIARALMANEADNQDHNLPQMIWYGIEPAVPENPERALSAARKSRVDLPARLIARRLADSQAPQALEQLLKQASASRNAKEALMYLAPVGDSLKGRIIEKTPEAWNAVYLRVGEWMKSAEDATLAAQLRDLRNAIGASLGDARAVPALMEVARDVAAGHVRRHLALQTLAMAKDANFALLLTDLLPDPTIRIEVLRHAVAIPPFEGIGGGGSAQFFRNALQRFRTFSAEEKLAAALAFCGRVSTAKMLLEAVAAGQVARSDVSGFAARQIAGLNDAELNALLESAWGRVNAPGSDVTAKAAADEHQRLKAILKPSFLKGANLNAGHELFKNICGQCHQLFGEGGRIGPDLTGSNRADLDYILENVTNPSSVIGKDYELHVLTLKDGRIVSGMIRSDAAELVTVQTLSNEEQVRKSDIASRQTLGVSMMPSGLFSALTNEQMRDLVAYLGTTAPSVGAAANPVAPSPAAPPTAPLFKAPGALEGEELKVMASTGKVVMQKMDRFRDGVWSDARHLWWVNAKPGDVLKLSVPVAKAGHYRLKAVLTRAPDYAIVRFSLDGKPVSLGQVDLFGSKVSNTEALVLAEADFNSGDHELAVEIIGANPQARPSFMFGLDYLLLE